MSEQEIVKSGSHLSIVARARRFILDVITELQKCSWPSRKELTETTIIVIVMMFIMSAFIFGVDMLFKGVFHNILKIT